MTASLRRYLPCLAALPTAILLFVLVSSGRFPLDGDSVCFLPIAENVARGEGLVNLLYEMPLSYSPSHDGRLIWHGFLAPLVWGAMARPANYAGVLFAIAMLGAISILVWALSCQRILLRPGVSATKQALFIFCGSIAIAGIVFNNGRPESLSSLWVCLACAGFAYIRPGSIRDGVFGAIMALIAVTTPIAAIMCALAYGIFATLTMPPSRWLPSAVTSAICGGVVMAACFAIYPYGFGEWIGGMQIHAQKCVINYNSSRHLYYWLVARPMLGGVALVAIITTSVCVFQAQSWFRKLAAGSFGVALLGTVAYFAPDGRNYNVLPLLPAIALFVFFQAAMLQDSSVPFQKIFCIALALLFAVSGSNFVRSLLIAWSSADYLSFAEAREEIARLDPMESVTVSSGLFTALPVNTGAKVVRSGSIPEKGEVKVNTKWFFLQQINPARAVPPTFTNYRLVTNRFSKTQPRLFGVSLANTSRGYNFALYEKISP